MLGRWPLIALGALLIASLIIIGLLGRSVTTDLRVLSTAQHDDVSWRMSQLEVELLRLQNVTLDALNDPRAELNVLRKRYDIFYSRITTLRQSALYQSFKDEPEIVGQLKMATDFLDKTTPAIDADNAALRAALDGIYQDITALAPAVRSLAHSGIASFTAQETARRETFSDTLRSLAIGIVVLITVLFGALATLIGLHRQGKSISLISDIARARFEAAISSSLDAVLVVDAKGHIIEFNGAAQSVFGYQREEVLGQDMVDLIVPQHLRDAHREGMARFLRTGDRKVIDAGRVRLQGLRKSGEVFPVELSISLSQAAGETVFVSYLRDITAELEAEEALKDALEKAQLGEKAKSNLLTVMSHEMRTPLNGILGSLDLIDQTSLSDRQKQHLNAIAVSGDLLLSHVNDVLDFSKLTSDADFDESATFDLSALITEVTDSLQPGAKAQNNTLSVSFQSEDLGYVRGAPRSLQRCLVNLIGNANKFTQNGVVNVEVERLSGGDVEIRVADTGVGIAPENLERIFEEFVTIDTAFARTNSGTGLGLAITKRLITQMGGDIDADSLLGEGSLFVLRLPLPVADAQTAPQSASAPSMLTSLPRAIHALVCDDNQINRNILSAILEELGATVTSVSNGFDAIAEVEAREFDVLMLDISMPEIDGIETLRRIRENSEDGLPLPAIAVTAHAAPADHKKILAAGFHNLLVKPVSRAAVHQCLAGVFDMRLTDQPTDAPAEPENEYLARFGPERFAKALAEMNADLSQLIATLEHKSHLTEADRDAAHKLSGSAAVLGQTDMWDTLQTLQHCPDTDWQADKPLLLATLNALLGT